MEIEGEVYVTGFYDYLLPSGITVGEDEPAAEIGFFVQMISK